MSAPFIDSLMTPCPFSLESHLGLERGLRWFEVKRLSVAPVVQKGRIIGVVSKSTLAQAQSDQKKKRELTNPTVADLCSPILVAVDESTPAYEAISRMAKCDASCAVVMRRTKVVGIVSMANVFESFSAMLRARGLTHQNETQINREKVQ